MTHRIYLAFDVDHDADALDRIASSTDGPPVFELCGRSRGGDMTDAWHQRARREIAAAEQVVFVCGEHTDASPQVAAELLLARELDKPFILLWSRRDVMCKKPVGALANDCMYSWTRQILEDQLIANHRKAQPPNVPERLKRVPPPE